MTKLEVGTKRIGPNSGEIYEVLATYEGPFGRRYYWAIGKHDNSPTSWTSEIESWKSVPNFFEEGATYKSPYGTVAIIKYVEEIGGKKYAFAHAIDTDGKHVGTTLLDMHYEFWKKQ